MTTASTPIPSTFADDPEMLEIIELFVEQMPTRIAAMENAWQDGDRSGLVRVAHQLKGAAGGYGYSEISEVAGSIERTLRDLNATNDEWIDGQLRTLFDLCRRVVVTSSA